MSLEHFGSLKESANVATRRPELRLGERERSRRDIAGALVAERTVPPQKRPSIGKTVLFLSIFLTFLGDIKKA